MNARDVMEMGQVESAVAVVRGLAAMADECERLREENAGMRRVCAAVEKALGDDRGRRYATDELADALRCRMMPEGMEWPRFEDGGMVKLGDVGPDCFGKRRKVEWVKFSQGMTSLGDGLLGRDCWWTDYDKKRVKRYVRIDEKTSEQTNSSQDSSIPHADSWEKLESDSQLSPSRYLEGRGIEPNLLGGKVCAMMADIVRRARALAGDVE